MLDPSDIICKAREHPLIEKTSRHPLVTDTLERHTLSWLGRRKKMLRESEHNKAVGDDIVGVQYVWRLNGTYRCCLITQSRPSLATSCQF